MSPLFLLQVLVHEFRYFWYMTVRQILQGLFGFPKKTNRVDYTKKAIYLDYIGQIKEIRSILESKGFGDLANDLLEQQLSCGTGGEVLMSINAKILGIKNEYPSAYEEIKGQAQKLLTYGYSLGYFPIAVSPKNKF